MHSSLGITSQICFLIVLHTGKLLNHPMTNKRQLSFISAATVRITIRVHTIQGMTITAVSFHHRVCFATAPSFHPVPICKRKSGEEGNEVALQNLHEIFAAIPLLFSRWRAILTSVASGSCSRNAVIQVRHFPRAVNGESAQNSPRIFGAIAQLVERQMRMYALSQCPKG